MAKIKYYPDEDHAPIKKLLEKLSDSSHSRQLKTLLLTLDMLEKYGFRINEEFKSETIKSFGNDLWEIRAFNVRIFFTYHKENQTIWLLHGFIKKSQKTPKKEIKQARIEIAKLREKTIYT